MNRQQQQQIHFEMILEALAKGFEQKMIARGHSMHPFIKDGSELNLIPVSRPLKIDDIVLVLGNDQQLIIHRIIGLSTENLFLLKGDARKSPDGWFKLHQILAIVKK